MTICWIPFPMVARFCWDGYTSFKKRSRWIFCVVCCTSWHHPTMIQLSIRFQFQRIYSKPATKATWHFAAFRSTKKNPPRMGSKPSFQCWVDIEGMISMMYQLVTSEWSEDGPSRLSVVFFFQFTPGGWLRLWTPWWLTGWVNIWGAKGRLCPIVMLLCNGALWCREFHGFIMDLWFTSVYIAYMYIYI